MPINKDPRRSATEDMPRYLSTRQVASLERRNQIPDIELNAIYSASYDAFGSNSLITELRLP